MTTHEQYNNHTVTFSLHVPVPQWRHMKFIITTHMTLTDPEFVLVIQLHYSCYVSFQMSNFCLQFTALFRQCIGLLLIRSTSNCIQKVTRTDCIVLWKIGFIVEYFTVCRLVDIYQLIKRICCWHRRVYSECRYWMVCLDINNNPSDCTFSRWIS